MYLNQVLKNIVGVIAVASVLVFSSAANAAVLTFDNLPGDRGNDGAISNGYNGYGGLQWSNFGVVSSDLEPAGSGYVNGAVSGTNTAYNMWGNPASFSSATAFDLDNAFFTAAWNDGLNVHVVATGGSNTYTLDFTIDTSAPLNVFFNWSGINNVTFFTSGGTHNAELNGYGVHFAMDNLAINMAPVPEPETYAMLLIGLGLLGFMARRKETLNF